MKVKVKSFSRVWLFVIPWTVAYQAPLSVGFPRQEYWSGLPCPSSGDLPDPGMEPGSPTLWELNKGACLLRNLHAGQEVTELDMEQWMVQKWERSTSRLYICHPAYVTNMQSISREMLGWMTHKLESRLLAEISTNSDVCRGCHSNGRKQRACWWRWKRRLKKLA